MSLSRASAIYPGMVHISHKAVDAAERAEEEREEERERGRAELLLLAVRESFYGAADRRRPAPARGTKTEREVGGCIPPVPCRCRCRKDASTSKFRMLWRSSNTNVSRVKW